MRTAVCLALLLLSQQPAAQGTLRGRVIDADGKPMAEATVVALAIGTDRDFVGMAALTKADGTFEITGVPPSRIIVRAQPRLMIPSGQARTPPVMHPPAYFPGTLERREAWAIDVKPGEVIELDIIMPPVFIGSIKTVVTGPPGYTLEYLRVIRPDSNQIKNVTLSDAGVGYADELRGGRHVVTARARAGDAILVASAIVEMTGGEIEVPLRLQPAARITGRISPDGGPVPRLDNIRVIATWTDGTMPLDPLARDESYVSADWKDRSFAIDGVFGRRTIQVAGLPEPWEVISIKQGANTIGPGGLDLAAGSTTELSIVVAQRYQWMPQPRALLAGTSSVRGIVVDADSGKPIEAAEVRLSKAEMEYEQQEVKGQQSVRSVRRAFTRSNSAVTDAQGAFAFDDIADGPHILFVTHRSYQPGCPPGPGSRSCTRFGLAPDQRITDARVMLQPAGIIRGRVLDVEGRPMRRATLSAENPERQRVGSAQSDDEGRFELASLPAGPVVLLIDPQARRPSWHRLMYYPGVRDRDDAQPITVEAGGAVDLDIRLKEIPSATINTALSGPAGFRVDKMMLAQPDTKMLVNVKVEDDGTASITDLEEGRYAIAARARAGKDMLAAYQLIIVGSGDYDVPMLLELTSTVRGRIVVDRGGVPPVTDVIVEAHWISSNGLKLDPMGPDRVQAGPDGAFTMRGLFGRRAFTLFGLPDEWRVVAVRANRSDVTPGIDFAPGSTTEIEIVVSRQ